jgi:hypothetical protein
MISMNFEALRFIDPELADIGAEAEQLSFEDPGESTLRSAHIVEKLLNRACEYIGRPFDREMFICKLYRTQMTARALHHMRCVVERFGICALVLLAMLASPTAAAAETEPCFIPKSLTRIRPDADGEPIRVDVGVYVLDLIDIDELQESFKVDFLLSLRWRDPRLSAEVRGPHMDDCTLGLVDIWDPAIHPVNQRGITRERERDVDIMPDGTVRFSERILGELSATMDLVDFPFDAQRLRIQLASFEYGPLDVVFVQDSTTTGLMEEAFIGGWEITSNISDTDVGPLTINSRQHTRLEHTIVIKRRSGYFMWKFVVPLLFIALMATSVFWIDPRAIAPQIGVATASVFSLIAFQIGLRGVLPEVDYLTRLDELVLYVTALVFLALGESVVTTRLAMQERYDTAVRIERISRWVYLSLLAAVLMKYLIL